MYIDWFFIFTFVYINYYLQNSPLVTLMTKFSILRSVHLLDQNFLNFQKICSSNLNSKPFKNYGDQITLYRRVRCERGMLKSLIADY